MKKQAIHTRFPAECVIEQLERTRQDQYSRQDLSSAKISRRPKTVRAPKAGEGRRGCDEANGSQWIHRNKTWRDPFQRFAIDEPSQENGRPGDADQNGVPA